MSPYFTFNEVVLLNKAIDWFNRNTCIRWTPKQRNDFDFVNIAKDGGCRAIVGRATVKFSLYSSLSFCLWDAYCYQPINY